MYLITGCAGFIGFSMCQYLLKKRYKVIGVDNLNQYYSKELKHERLNILKKNKNFSYQKIDLCNKKKINKLLYNLNDIKIIHFAAQPGVMYSYKNPKSYFDNNILATNNLVNESKKIKINQFIFISSSSVYGDKKKYPITENSKLSSINYYAETKNICERIVKKNQAYLSKSIKILRPFTVYGPFGRPDMLILKLLTHIKKKQKINIYNFGKYLRDFTYIDDVVKIIFELSNKENRKLKIYNICASRPIEINKILYLIKKYNKKIPIMKFMPKRKGEMLITYGSNKKLLNDIKFDKFTSVEEGLKKTIKWFKSFKNKKSLYLHK